MNRFWDPRLVLSTQASTGRFDWIGPETSPLSLQPRIQRADTAAALREGSGTMGHPSRYCA